MPWSCHYYTMILAKNYQNQPTTLHIFSQERFEKTRNNQNNRNSWQPRDPKISDANTRTNDFQYGHHVFHFFFKKKCI